MYMHDGKPVVPPTGRRNPDVNKLEFDKLLQRVEKLESIVFAMPEKEQPIQDDIEALKNEAMSLGIEAKGNWGAKRIKQAIDEKKSPGGEE